MENDKKNKIIAIEIDGEIKVPDDIDSDSDINEWTESGLKTDSVDKK